MQTRRVKAGQPVTQLPHHVEEYLKQEIEHKSTPESRLERARIWRTAVIPSAIVTASVLAALVMAFLPNN